MTKKYYLSKKKERAAKELDDWISTTEARKEKYGNVLYGLQQLCNKNTDVLVAGAYVNFAGFAPLFVTHGINIWRFNRSWDEKVPDESALKRLKDVGYPEGYDVEYDREVLTEVLSLMKTGLPADFAWNYFEKSIYTNAKGSPEDKAEEVANEISDNSIITNVERYNKFLKKPKKKTLVTDPGFQFIESLIDYFRNTIQGPQGQYNAQLSALNNLYVQALMESKPNQPFYPDGDGTLRFSYGKIAPFDEATSISLAKDMTIDEDAESTFIDVVSAKVKENSTLSFAFLASIEATGGSSGAPILNSDGELIGIVMDSHQEGVDSDYSFHEKRTRTTCLSAEYISFIIKEVAMNTYLSQELGL